MGDYLFLKSLHVTGAVLLVGNVTVTGFWALFMYRRRHEVPFRPVAYAILATDLWFTFLGGAMLTITGILMARQAGMPLLGTPWIRHGLSLLVVSTLSWLTILLPDQYRLATLDPAAPGYEARLRRTFTRWNVVGWLSTGLLFAAVWFMVYKT